MTVYGWIARPTPTLRRIVPHRAPVGSRVWLGTRLCVVDGRDGGGWLTVTPVGRRGPLTSETMVVRVEDVERI